MTWRCFCDLCRREISLPSSNGSLIEAKRTQLVHMLEHGEMSKRMMSIVRREEVLA